MLLLFLDSVSNSFLKYFWDYLIFGNFRISVFVFLMVFGNLRNFRLFRIFGFFFFRNSLTAALTVVFFISYGVLSVNRRVLERLRKFIILFFI